MKSIAKKELVIGASVIVAIVVLFFGIDYLKGINLLNPTNFYYADYENVSGLEVSAPVNVNGYKVGQVRSIEYDYDNPGHIKVLIAVNNKLKVPEDSHAVLASTLLSGGYVDLQLGTSKKYLEVGSTISSKTSSDLMEAVNNEIMPAVEQILPKVDSLLANLNKLVADPALQQSIQRFDGITANVLGVTEGLNTTMSRDVPMVMRNAKSLTTKIDTVSYNLVQLSHSLRQLPLSTTIDNVNAVTANLEAFSNQLNDKNSTLGLLTTDPELYNRLNRVSADVDSLIVDIKKNPKRYISIKLL
jgi:phospholipid/cholesterol/gamma-HCH transport system substrate-binding protein